MGLGVAVLVQVLLGGFLFWLGRWGRLAADTLVSPRLEAAEHRRRADGVARGGLFCQAIGVVLMVFALVTAVAGAAGAA